MADTERSYPRIRNIFWPIIWIIVGLLLLFNNFGLVPWSIWGTLWQLWPLLLIFWGISLIFGRTYTGRLITTITILIVVLLILILLLTSNIALPTTVQHVYGASSYL